MKRIFSMLLAVSALVSCTGRAPKTYASREVPGGVEYLFGAESPAMDGGVSTSQVYVLVEDGAEPEFTRVVR